MMRSWQRYLCFIVLFAACGRSPAEPTAAADTVVLLGTEAGEILVVHPGLPGIGGPERLTRIPRFLDAFALSPDRSVVYFTAFDELPDRTLHAFDLSDLELLRSRRISEMLDANDTQHVVDSGAEAIAVSPDGSTLFIAGWRSAAQILGVAAVDARTFDVVGFVGPLRVRSEGLATLAPSEDHPRGAVLALGRRQDRSDPEAVHLFVIDPDTHEVVDSLAQPVADTAAYQIVPAADGRHVYLSGRYSLARYDLAAEAVRERVELPTLGWLTSSPDGLELYRSDRRAAPDTPGEGRVFVFGPDLVRRTPVDLSAHPDDGFPPVVLSVTPSGDGERLYVVTGTARFGVAPPFQLGRLFVVRLADRSVERVIPLESWNVGPAFVVP